MPEICLMTKSWRYSAGWIAQMIAQSVAEGGATIAYVAPLAEPSSREPEHANLVRIRSPRELVGDHPRGRRALASLRRIFVGVGRSLALRRSTNVYLFTIPEPLPVTLPLFALLRLSGARVIYIVHDAQPHAWSIGPRLRFLERAGHALSYQLASTLVALTPSVGTALEKQFRVHRSKVVVIPHGPLTVGDVPPLAYGRKLLIFGALRKNKSVLEVIQGVLLARQRGNKVVLILAGEPLKQESDYWTACEHAMRLDPDGFDVRVGFVPEERLPSLIAEADAFVLAYQNFDSQSGVGVLAALAGRPVIGTRAGGLGELFDQGMSGIAIEEPPTPAGVSSAISDFYAQDGAYWRQLAAAGKEQMAGHLRWDRIASAYISLARAGSAAGPT